MKKRVFIKFLSTATAILMALVLLPASALPQGDFVSSLFGSEAPAASTDSLLLEQNGVASDDTVTLVASDGQQGSDLFLSEGDAQTDALTGDMVIDNGEDWGTAEDAQSLGGSASVAPVYGPVASSSALGSASVSNATLVGAKSGYSPYDPIDMTDVEIYTDTEAELDPFQIGGAAWLDRDKLYYGAPATPTIPFSEWVANTSVVNTTGVDGVDGSILFPDKDLMSEASLEITYTNNSTISGATGGAVSAHSLTTTGGYAYFRYDYAYEKWGITLDKNVLQATWAPNQTFSYTGQPYLYYSIEQEEAGETAIALQIKAPDNSVRWYTVTDNRTYRGVTVDGNPDQTPDIRVTTGSAPILSTTGFDAYHSGALTACIDLATWLPTLVGDNSTYGNYNFTVQQVRVYSKGDKPVRINYLYMAPSTGNSLVNQVKTADQSLGSSAESNHNGWGNAECVTVINTADEKKIVIDTTKDVVDGNGVTTTGSETGKEYVLVTIPVRRWYNILRDSRILSFSIESQNYSSGDDDAPTMSLWGNASGHVNSVVRNASDDPHRMSSDEIIGVFGTGGYLVDYTHYEWITAGIQKSNSVDTDYDGNYNYIDMLRSAGAYSHMIKSQNNIFGTTAVSGIGYVFISNIRVMVRPGDVVTLKGSTMTGANAGINDNKNGKTLDGGSGIQPIIAAGTLNTAEAAANAPQLRTSEYGVSDLLPSDCTMRGDIYKVTAANVFFNEEPIWKSGLDSIPINTAIVVLGTITYSSGGNVWGYICNSTFTGKVATGHQYGWVQLCGDNNTWKAEKLTTYSNALVFEKTYYSQDTYAAYYRDAVATETAKARDSMKLSFHGYWQSTDGSGGVPDTPWQTFYAVADTAIVDDDSYLTSYNWSYNSGFGCVNSVSSLKNSICQNSHESDFELNPNDGGSLSVSHSVNVPLWRINSAATDNMYAQGIDVGWPVLYYDLTPNLQSNQPISIALTLKRNGTGTDAGEEHVAYLYFDVASKKCTLSDYDYNGNHTNVALDCGQKRFSQAGAYTYTGYISLKEFSGYDFWDNGVHYQDPGYIITGVYFYTRNYGGTFHRLGVRVDDWNDWDTFDGTIQSSTQQDQDKRFALAINTNQDGGGYNGFGGFDSSTGKAILSSNFYDVSKQGDLVVYDSINIADVTIGKAYADATWWQSKNWRYDSVNSNNYGFANVTDGTQKSAYTAYLPQQASSSQYGVNRFQYKLNSGNVRIEAPYGSGTIDETQGIVKFATDRSFEMNDYKYLYFSFAMRQSDGDGYVTADGQSGMMLMLRYGSDENDQMTYFLQPSDLNAENAGFSWRLYDQRTSNLWNHATGASETAAEKAARLSIYSSFDPWTDTGYFATAATGCIDLSSFSSFLEYSDGTNSGRVIGMSQLDSIALWCRNATGQDATFHINYLVLSNREPTDAYITATEREITQYIYLMDNTGNRYSQRFPTEANITGEVRQASQRINPLKIRRGLKIYEGTYYNEDPLSGKEVIEGEWESAHDYENNMDQTWTVHKAGATAISITFSDDTATEATYDKIYLTDANGNQVGDSAYYTGTALQGKTFTADGDTLNIHFTSDNSVVKYGFRVTKAVATMPIGSSNWFYTSVNPGENTNILDIYQYQGATNTISDMRWQYGRWYNPSSVSLYWDSGMQGKLLEHFVMENQVLLRQGIEPRYFVTNFNTNGGQMTYFGSAAGTGVSVNENNYYTTNTTLFDTFNYPVTSSRALKPVRTGYTFLGWYRTPQVAGTENSASYTVPSGVAATKLYRSTVKEAAGDNTYYAHWRVNSSFTTAYSVSFRKVGATGTTWFTYTANQSNHYLINLPSILQVNTGSGIKRIVGWKTSGEDKVYAPGTKLMISANVTLYPVLSTDQNNGAVTITLTNNATLGVVSGTDANGLATYNDPAAQHIDVTQNGSTRVYSNVPVNLRLVVIPETASPGSGWQATFGSASPTLISGKTSFDICHTYQQYVFTAYTDMRISYVSGRGTSPVVYSCPNVPVENCQMDFYAQVDLNALSSSGYTFVAAGTLYTKDTQYPNISGDLDTNMRLDPASIDATTAQTGAFSTVTSAVRQKVATSINESGQYRFSVTVNNGNATRYYTRAYCVYKSGSSYLVVYSDVISNAFVDARAIED